MDFKSYNWRITAIVYTDYSVKFTLLIYFKYRYLMKILILMTKKANP